jgi:glycerophosphoryl diester phosphodiesterase
MNPLIIGHRGASAVAPENTIVAFEEALLVGADGVEFDVRLARDNVAVVIHDATLRRTALREGLVASLTSEVLSLVDVGTWFNLRNPARARVSFANEGVPTLRDTLKRIGDRTKAVYVEMKGEAASNLGTLATAVVETIREIDLVGRAIVKSFHHKALIRVKSLDPEIRTAALFDRSIRRPMISMNSIIRQARACEADEISLHFSLARRSVVEAAREQGFEVVVWTVDNPAWVKKARLWGIRSVITNDPERLRSALHEEPE